MRTGPHEHINTVEQQYVVICHWSILGFHYIVFSLERYFLVDNVLSNILAPYITSSPCQCKYTGRQCVSGTTCALHAQQPSGNNWPNCWPFRPGFQTNLPWHKLKPHNTNCIPPEASNHTHNCVSLWRYLHGINSCKFSITTRSFHLIRTILRTDLEESVNCVSCMYGGYIGDQN